MNITRVTAMLHNRKYIGEFRCRDVVRPHGIPAIVPEELFEQVQQRMNSNKKAPARYKAEEEYLLTTKLYCGYCHCFMAGESGTAKNGTTHRCYKCVSVKHHRGCSKKSVRKNWIESAAIFLARKIIFDDDLIVDVAATVVEELSSDSLRSEPSGAGLVGRETGGVGTVGDLRIVGEGPHDSSAVIRAGAYVREFRRRIERDKGEAVLVRAGLRGGVSFAADCEAFHREPCCLCQLTPAAGQISTP